MSFISLKRIFQFKTIFKPGLFPQKHTIEIHQRLTISPKHLVDLEQET